MVQETIGVAPKVIELCEDASPAVEERVKELKCRVGHLMIIIIDHVTSQNDVEGSKKAFVNAMKCVEWEIRELLSTLRTIYEDLEKTGGQKALLITTYTKDEEARRLCE